MTTAQPFTVTWDRRYHGLNALIIPIFENAVDIANRKIHDSLYSQYSGEAYGNAVARLIPAWTNINVLDESIKEYI